jgi:formylglycine-generating enzyme required for sulfatase activity
MRPVEQVSWHDAVEFCQRLSRYTNRQYRLPSEAEWEYACRAGTTTPFHFGLAISRDFVNCKRNVGMALISLPASLAGLGGETTEVGSFNVANAFGLYDMHGNVWEWCQDVWHGNYEGAPTDGSAWIEGGDQERRVLRGGSWLNVPGGCRSAYRFRVAPDGITTTLVFGWCAAARRVPLCSFALVPFTLLNLFPFPFFARSA